MSLSFREQAAIAIFTISDDADSANQEDAVFAAQHLANVCCEEWGHERGHPIAIGWVCARCGDAITADNEPLAHRT